MFDTGIEVIFSFFATFILLLERVFNSDALASFNKRLPRTLYMAQKLVGHTGDPFVHYTICPKCKTLYGVEHCRIQLPDKIIVSKKCDHKEFPDHPFVVHRAPCGTVLMKKVRTSAGTTYLHPRNLYCYQSLLD